MSDGNVLNELTCQADTPVGYVSGRSALYGHVELKRLIDPASIAVVGASETQGSFGSRTLENIRVGYKGRILPVNPRYGEINGMTCYASLEDLPEVPDCVIVIVPMAQVESLVEQAASMGVGGMIIYSAGFAEVGDLERVLAQHRIAEISQNSGLRILGPNCVGIANLASRVGMTFMPQFNEMPMVQGDIGLVSQSGALGYCVLQAMERGIGFSHYLSPGNSCDVDVCDMINYLVEDKSTRVIACMFEGVRDGARLQKAALCALEANKPLLIYKLAHSEISQRTALSHTGTIAGAAAPYNAVFQQTGVVVIDNWEDMLETAVLFSKAGAPRSAGIGVMASSGGAAVMAADKAEEFGLSLPSLAQSTSDSLARVLPDFGSISNPCDLTAESLKSMQMYGDCIRAFAADPGFAAIVVPMMSAQRPATVERAKYLSQLADELDKPMCLVWINEWLQGPGSEVYDACLRISMFRSMSRCIKSLKQWLTYYERKEILLKRAMMHMPQVKSLFAREYLLQNPGPRTLGEFQSKRILASYGIEATRGQLVDCPSAAVQAARDIGYPVALKLDSNEIPHKTEAGVVRLNIDSDEELICAAAELLDIAQSLPGSPAISGLLVQSMATNGIEMMVGTRKDSQFGLLVLVGFGGIDVELQRDVAIALAPVGRDCAREMILSLRKSPLLTGYRNIPPMNIEMLIDVVCLISQAATDLSDIVEEIDINPFFLTESSGLAADALIVRAPLSHEGYTTILKETNT